MKDEVYYLCSNPDLLKQVQNLTTFKDTAMKCIHLIILSIALFLLCACTLFYPKQSATNPAMQSPKPLSMPVGKNWQMIEEAPKLSEDGTRLPFQTEQSVQPEGAAKPVAPVENRIIETPR